MSAALITEPALIEAVRQVAATEPERIYDNGERMVGCLYTPNELNCTGCLVGEALVLLGVPVAVLENIDLVVALQESTSWGSPPIMRELAEYLNDAALHSPWVQHVQYQQDLDVSWADAVAEADSNARMAGWVH